MHSGFKLPVWAPAIKSEGCSEDDLNFNMLLGSPIQDRFPSISVSVTLLSILIKYVSQPQAYTAKMEISNGSNRKSYEGYVSVFRKGKSKSRGKA